MKFQVFLYNYKERMSGKQYTIEGSKITRFISKNKKKISDKDGYIIVACSTDTDDTYLYSIDGELLYKEYSETKNVDGEELSVAIPYDYTIKDINEGDIVYCEYDNHYYIMMLSDNNPTRRNIDKFWGLNDYPDDFIMYGIPEYFLRKASEDEIKNNELEYLYEMKKLYDKEDFLELFRYSSLVLEEKGKI